MEVGVGSTGEDESVSSHLCSIADDAPSNVTSHPPYHFSSLFIQPTARLAYPPATPTPYPDVQRPGFCRTRCRISSNIFWSSPASIAQPSSPPSSHPSHPDPLLRLHLATILYQGQSSTFSSQASFVVRTTYHKPLQPRLPANLRPLLTSSPRCRVTFEGMDGSSCIVVDGGERGGLDEGTVRPSVASSSRCVLTSSSASLDWPVLYRPSSLLLIFWSFTRRPSLT